MRKLLWTTAALVGVLVSTAGCTPPVEVPTGPTVPTVLPEAPMLAFPPGAGPAPLAYVGHFGEQGAGDLFVDRTSARPILGGDQADHAIQERMFGHVREADGWALRDDLGPTPGALGLCPSLTSTMCTSVPVVYATDFSFSPDGSMIAVVSSSDPLGDTPDGRLHVFRTADMTEVVRLDAVRAWSGPHGPRWRADSRVIAIPRLTEPGWNSPNELVTLDAVPGATPDVVVPAAAETSVSTVLGWSSAGRIVWASIDPTTGGAELRSVDPTTSSRPRSLVEVDPYQPGVLLADGSVIANPPNRFVGPRVPVHVLDEADPVPRPIARPVSWVAGGVTRWSSTTVLGLLPAG